MKLVKITMELVVEDDTRPDKWVFQSVADQLENGEDIVDFQCEVIGNNVPELELIETFNKA